EDVSAPWAPGAGVRLFARSRDPVQKGAALGALRRLRCAHAVHALLRLPRAGGAGSVSHPAVPARSPDPARRRAGPRGARRAVLTLGPRVPRPGDVGAGVADIPAPG